MGGGLVPPWLQPRAGILRTLRSVQRKIRHSHCREIPGILLQISTKLDENINVVEKKISVDASSKQYPHFLYRQCCYFLPSQLPSYDLFSMLRVVFAGNGSNRRARVTFTKYVCLLLLHSANHSFSDILIENECNMRPNLFLSGSFFFF